MRAALVKDGIVHNVIEVADGWDKAEWDGYQVVVADDCEIEDRYDGKRFTRAPRVEPPIVKSEIEELKERITALEARLQGVR